MKKLVLAMSLITVSTVMVHAQESMAKKTSLSIGPEAGIPVGTPGVNLLYSFAIGGSLQVVYLISPNLGVTLNAGYLDYIPKNGEKPGGLIPVLGGFRYFLNQKVYAAGQLGVSFSTINGGPGPLSSGGSFSYAAGIGFQVSTHVDILARYEAAPKNSITIGNIGARIAYSFK